MFLLISGAAASGKTTFARRLRERLEDVVCHDADEMVSTTSYERCANLETWVRRALDAQRQGRDFLLATHSPLGELLACPSAPGLAGIAACLLDCADPVRVNRIRARGIDPRWPPNQHTLNWAAWHRMHARDPQWEPHVVDGNGPPTHRYDRWRGWTRDDPRWHVFILDTTQLTVDAAFGQLLAWVQAARSTPSPLTAASRWWNAGRR